MNVAIVEGRPSRGWNGRVHRARARLGHSHLTDQRAMQLRPDVRRALADHWRGLGEVLHSSFVAYQDLARRLAMLDAPSELVHRSIVAAEQAGHNGAQCFELAGRYLGRSMRQGRLRRPLRLPRSRQSELCAMALESLLDGVLLEGYAARMASARAARATDARAADALTVLAADSLSRAALSLDVLTWLVEVGGDPVAAVVRHTALGLPDHAPRLLVPTHLNAHVLADHGLFDADPEGAVFATLADAVRSAHGRP
ncbi:MAG: hypothetical protein ACOYMR_09120 [Ilumatobacteraceae bacterium]